MIRSPAGFDGDVRIKRRLDYYQASYGVMMLAAGQAAPFTPAELFAAGEQGFWYDTSDLTTMFKDAAGTQPCELEQPVMLRLDKSKGLVLGSELLVNGDFSSGTTGWLTFQGAVSSSSGVGKFTASAADARLYKTSDVVAGKTYEVSCNIVSISAGTLSISWNPVQNNAGQTTTPYATTTAGTTYRFKALATSAYLTVVFKLVGTSGDYFEVDNVSVRELPGNHAVQTTSANAPVLSARVNLFTQTEDLSVSPWGNTIAGTGVNPTVTATAGTSPTGTNTATRVQLSLGGGTSTADVSRRRQAVTVAAVAHTFSIYLRSYDGTSSYNMHLVGADGLTTNIVVTGTWQMFSVDAVGIGSAVNFSIGLRGGQTPANSNTADVLAWGADLRVSNESSALPAYQRVTTASDYAVTGFPYYLRYNGTNQWMQTAAINFSSTDKMSVFAGVRKLSDAATAMLAELSADGSSTSGTFFMTAPSSNGLISYRFNSRGATGNGIAGSTAFAAAPDTSIMTGLGDIGAPSATLRRNGVLIEIGTTAQGGGNYGSYPLYLGARAGSSLWFNGRDYGLIGVGRAVTAAELANTENYMEQQTFGKDMQYVYTDQVFAADGVTEITAADGDPIYMSVSYV